MPMLSMFCYSKVGHMTIWQCVGAAGWKQLMSGVWKEVAKETAQHYVQSIPLYIPLWLLTTAHTGKGSLPQGAGLSTTEDPFYLWLLDYPTPICFDSSNTENTPKRAKKAKKNNYTLTTLTLYNTIILYLLICSLRDGRISITTIVSLVIYSLLSLTAFADGINIINTVPLCAYAHSCTAADTFICVYMSNFCLCVFIFSNWDLVCCFYALSFCSYCTEHVKDTIISKHHNQVCSKDSGMLSPRK